MQQSYFFASCHSCGLPLVMHDEAIIAMEMEGRSDEALELVRGGSGRSQGTLWRAPLCHQQYGPPARLIHLVFLRVSQINGCAHCIDLHTRDLLKTMPIDKIALLPVWDEVPHLFPDQYRAALAWAEEVTRVSETHASDEAYIAAAKAFEPKDLVDLTIAIAAMNAFNRLGAPFRLPVAAKP